MDQGASTSLTVDLKRRTTMPASLLEAADIQAGTRLLAHVNEAGQIVLTKPGARLAALQADISAQRARALAAGDGSLEASGADELIAERRQDTSLDLPAVAGPPGDDAEQQRA